MDYEKAYKKALERARKCLDENRDTCFVRPDVIFPELAESEDERTRKAILNYFTKCWGNSQDDVCGVHVEDAIAWIEKQGEQKPADTVEPKFKVGDWLCENEPNNYARFIQILEIVDVQGKERYRISRDIHNDEDTVEFRFIEKYYHKFDIKDAKDGDVLVHNSIIFIFMGIENGIVKGICTELSNIISYLGIPELDNDYCPATKEQRELLFVKIKEDGYEWDAEKKELREIEKQGEQNPIDKVEPKFHEGKQKPTLSERYENIAKSEWFKKTHEGMSISDEESKWTDKDEERLQSCISTLQGKGLMGGVDTIDTKWLKSLKQRIEQ